MEVTVMKRTAFFSVIFLAILLAPLTLSHALFDSDVDKAKDFMKAGMYPQAIDLLNIRINQKPTDAEAHFQLGICYLKTGNYRGADERFTGAVNLKPEYGQKVGAEYRKAGSAALARGNTGQAQGLFQQAVKYQPNLKDSIVKEAYGKGKTLFDQGSYNGADNMFGVATAFDSSLNKQICDMYFDLGQKAGESECVNFYSRTKSYCSDHNKAIGDRLLAISKTKKSESEVQKWRKEAANYTEVPPDYKTYYPGQHIFKMKAGEITDHWIHTPDGVMTDYLFSSDNKQYEIRYRDGKVVRVWAGEKVPSQTDADFKIYAVKDTLVVLTTKEAK
jgi:tetratricopeptide (TPR) repeat protein